MSECGEFNSLKRKSQVDRLIKFWGNEETELLRSLYKENVNKFKRKKEVWATISNSLKEHQYDYTALQCENKWKTIVRAKKGKANNPIIFVSPKLEDNSATTDYSIELDSESIVPDESCSKLKGAIKGNLLESAINDAFDDCGDEFIDEEPEEDEMDVQELFKEEQFLTNQTSSDLKDIVTSIFSFIEKREKRLESIELRKIQVMEYRNRILAEKNRLIQERNNILLTRQN